MRGEGVRADDALHSSSCSHVAAPPLENTRCWIEKQSKAVRLDDTDRFGEAEFEGSVQINDGVMMSGRFPALKITNGERAGGKWGR